MAELLVLKGADVNAADDDWWTPLHVACYQDNADIVQLLLTVSAHLFVSKSKNGRRLARHG